MTEILPIPDMTNVGAFDKNGLQFVWDSTSASNAQSCLRKYYYNNIRALSRSTIKSHHLIFGGIFASALEQYYKLIADGQSHDEATCAVIAETLTRTWFFPKEDGTGFAMELLPFKINSGIGTFTDAKGETYFIEGGHAWDSEDPHKNRFTICRSIVWYLEHYRNDTATVVTFNGRPAVELTFKLDFGDGLIYAGHLDRLVVWQGHNYVMDQKTTKITITSRYFDSWSPSTQMTGYTWAGKMLYKTPVKGVIIDAAQIAVGFTRFERGFTFRSDDHLDEWFDDTHFAIEAARKATTERYFPMNPTACHNYGGCIFRKICATPPNLRKHVIAGDYTTTPHWDPSKNR